MDLEEIIESLEAAVQEPTLLPAVIFRLQKFVCTNSSLPAGVDGILRDLAYDLDFFEPDASIRSEDPSFVDQDAAIVEISQAITSIRELMG